MSLGAGGVAQWGWDRVSDPGGGATELTVTSPQGAAAAAAGSREAARPGVTPPATRPGATIQTQGKRVSRGTPRATAPAKPAPGAGKAGTKPSSSPSPSRTKAPRSPGRAAVPSIPSDAVTTLEAEVVALTNVERGKNGCGPLRADDKLADAARGHSEDMEKRDFFDHTTPDGVDPWQRAKAKGYEQPSGENIARGQQTPADVVESWMNSPGHRQNIVNCDSKAIGIGVATGPGGPWWTQMFGFK